LGSVDIIVISRIQNTGETRQMQEVLLIINIYRPMLWPSL
jgi:hypothetical protein